jgi:hypothetical protein
MIRQLLSVSLDYGVKCMGVWQEVAMDSQKELLGPGMPCLFTPSRRQPLKRPYSHFRGDHLQSGWLVAVFYPLGHPTPYASAENVIVFQKNQISSLGG